MISSSGGGNAARRPRSALGRSAIACHAPPRLTKRGATPASSAAATAARAVAANRSSVVAATGP
jgi:hypothetical protein